MWAWSFLLASELSSTIANRDGPLSCAGRGQVFFYPKDNTPGCTKEAQAFQADLAEFQKLKAKVIGISSDEDHSEFVSNYGLKMTLLSDVGGKVRGLILSEVSPH